MVNFEKFLNFSTHHSESIIQWVFFIILALCGFLIARGLFSKSKLQEAVGADATDTQALLKKIIEQTAKIEGLSPGELKSGEGSQFEAQLGSLRKDLQSRDEEIARLKAGGNSASGGADVSGRIKELEEKLAEYEILEDDIADLTLYKDENSRLRAELDKVKGVTTPAPTLSSRPGIAIPDTGDPMADFESTVELEKQLQAKSAEIEEVSAQGAPVPAAEAPAVAPPAPATPVDEALSASAGAGPAAPSAEGSDDIFSEFTQEQMEPTDSSDNPAPQPKPVPTASQEEAVDTNKMLEEMAALSSVAPAQGNALEESIDIEKMALEAKAPEQT